MPGELLAQRADPHERKPRQPLRTLKFWKNRRTMKNWPADQMFSLRLDKDHPRLHIWFKAKGRTGN